MSKELAKIEPQAMAVAPSDMLNVIARAVSDPALDVGKMSKLLDMHERIVADQRKTAFFAAMARVAPLIPEIGQHGAIRNSAGTVQSKYALLGDIDRVIRPILAAEGLSQSFDSEMSEGNVRVICRLSHAEGHSETKSIVLPIDKSGSKNGTQAVVSTVSYGRKCLTKMFFNIQESGEDTDGADPTTISPEQVRDLETLIQDTKSDKANFLRLIAGVTELKDIQARDFKRVMNALEEKLRLAQSKATK